MPDMPQILTFRAVNSGNTNIKFMACFLDARGELVVSKNGVGDTPEQATETLVGWWNRMMNKEPAATPEKVATPAPVKLGKGEHFASFKWMVNKKGNTERVPEDEIPQWEAKGYIRGRKWVK